MIFKARKQLFSIIKKRFLKKTEFDLAIRDLCITILVKVFTNWILTEITYFTKPCRVNTTQDYGLELANKYQIIWQCHRFKNTLIEGFQHQSFLYPASFVNIIFYGAENNKSKRRDDEPFTYLFSIWFTLVPKNNFAELFNTRKSGLSRSIEMHYF